MERARRIIQTDVRFIHSAEFEQPQTDNSLTAADEVEITLQAGLLKAPANAPVSFSHLWQVALLKPQEEQRLFYQMNFRKYLASLLRSQLNPVRPDVRVMNRIEQYLADAERIRNHIIQANLRLVVSITRRFVNNFVTLDELTSDGNIILMKSVDRFDYSRGFRFSTYATRALQRGVYRSYRNRQRRRLVEVATDPEVLFQSVDASEDLEKRLHKSEMADYVRRLMSDCLDPREYQIITRRIGLHSDDGGQTLREVGETLQISKERVRQMQRRALQRLRQILIRELDEQK